MEEQKLLTMEEQRLLPYGDDGTPSPTLRDALAVLYRHRRLMVVSFLAISLGAVLAALVRPQQYEAQMKLLVKRERVDPVVTPQPTTPPPYAHDVTEEEMNSEVELLKSRDLLEKVVVACGLDTNDSSWASRWPLSLFRFSQTRDANKAKAEGPNMALARTVRRLGKQLQADTLKKSNLIAVSYESSDPALAARVLTTLSNFYLDKHVQVHRSTGALDFFRKETERYRDELAAAEARLSEYNRNKGVVSASREKENTLQKLTEFEAALHQTQAAIRQTEQRVRALEGEEGSTPARLVTQVRTSDSAQLVQQLKSNLLTLELKRTELLTKFEPSYRPVQEVEKEIAQTQAALAAAEKAPVREETTDRDPTYQWVRSELAKDKSDLASLRARATAEAEIVRAYRENALRLDEKDTAQQDLILAEKAAQENYLLYLHKQEEARIAEALDRQRIVNVAIAEAATIPSVPSNPRWVTVLLGGLLASVVSVGLAFTSDYLDASFRTPYEVQKFLNVPVLAEIPKSGGGAAYASRLLRPAGATTQGESGPAVPKP